MNSKNLLTFELAANGQEIHIHGDKAGLTSLVSALERLIETGGHDHLMTPAWGGVELSEEAQSDESKILNKVTIHRW